MVIILCSFSCFESIDEIFHRRILFYEVSSTDVSADYNSGVFRNQTKTLTCYEINGALQYQGLRAKL